MSQMIESMESRLLFTASVADIKHDLAVLQSAGAAAKADLIAALATAKADTKTLKSEVVAAHPTATQKAVFTTYGKGELTAAAKYKKTVAGILAAGVRDGTKLESALLSLEAHPTSTAVQAKVQADLTALEGVFSTSAVNAVESNASTSVSGLDTDLNALATSVPSTQTEVTAAESHFASDLTTLSTQATAIQGDIATLATDLS